MSTVIGTTLKGRYQIEAKLGEGGAAEVFRARDNRLSRTVVVKVLRPQLASNADVLTRFRREATDAARLSHPSIVGVYDIEEESELHFIVMEYCDGGDLKRYLTANGGRLPLERAMEISQAVLMALDFAHKNGIVHRDVKPHNILLSSPSQVKLGDFGIARALASDTQTQNGTFVGSAAYLSPEQAQGYKIDATSDLYSFGVVLYEMLTGRLPFDADNPVTLALKHVQEMPPSARMLRPDVISERLDGVLLRAMAKDPTRRYQTAAEFALALSNAVTLPSAPPAMPAARGHGSDPPAAMPVTVPVEPVFIPQPASRPAATPPPPVAEAPGPRTLVLGGLVLVVILVALWFGSQYIFGKTVPDLRGESQSQARQAVDEAGLHMRIDDTRYDKDVAPGTILDQSPKPGTTMRAGDWVSVVVSRGTQEVDVPKVEGLDLPKARELVESRGLKLTVREENNPTVPEGIVVDQTPSPGNVAHLQTIVDVVVSKGPALVAVPDLAGKTEDVAKKTLEQLGLQMEVLDPVSDATVPKGSVVSVKPSPGSMLRHDGTVQVVLSLGPPRFVVPDLVGMTWGAARGKCAEGGFKLQLEGSASVVDADIVVAQSPSADSRVNVPAISARIKRAEQNPLDTPTISIPENGLTMPYLVGNTEEEARAVLAEKGLTVGEIEHRDSDKPAGTVVGTFPDPGVAVPAGQSVTIYISTGQPSSTPETP